VARHARGRPVEVGIIDVVWTAGGVLVGGVVEGGVVNVVCTAGGAVVGGMRQRSRAVDCRGGGCTRKAVVKYAPVFAPSQ
jgi:hypothetical protein